MMIEPKISGPHLVARDNHIYMCYCCKKVYTDSQIKYCSDCGGKIVAKEKTGETAKTE